MSDGTFEGRLNAEWHETISAADVPAASDLAERAGAERASRRAVVVELEEVRILVEEVISSLDQARSLRLATRQWTVFDVLAHLASWARETRVEVERLLAGQSFDEVIHFGLDGPHAWNQREVDARRNRAPAQLLAEIEAETERLIELLTDMQEEDVWRQIDLPRTIGEPAAPWRMPLSSMIVMTCWHARGHLGRLERLLRNDR